jgi:hypothetical protein
VFTPPADAAWLMPYIVTGAVAVGEVHYLDDWTITHSDLDLVFDPTTPVPDAWNEPLGLAIDAGRVPEELTWNRKKFETPNLVAVSGPSFGAVQVTNAAPGAALVRLDLSSTLTTAAAALAMAALYLPDVDTNRWAADSFTWLPTDAELAALPFPLAPDADWTSNVKPICFYAQVAVNGIPPAINPTSDTEFYAGSLRGAAVVINRGKVSAELVVTRRLPSSIDDPSGPALGQLGVTWADLLADFPTVTWTGDDRIDPALTWYDLRLVRTENP